MNAAVMKLGDLMKDRVTGFEGVATGVADYLTGCRQWLLSSQKLKPDGDAIAMWIDEIRLEVTHAGVISLPASAIASHPGGPSSGPSRTVQSPPTR